MQRKIHSQAILLSRWYEQYARMIFATMSVVFCVTFFTYVFFVVSSLSSGVAYQQVSREIRSVESRIAELEAERISHMKAVDLAFAKERGFVDVVPTRYISKSESTERFSLRGK